MKRKTEIIGSHFFCFCFSLDNSKYSFHSASISVDIFGETEPAVGLIKKNKLIMSLFYNRGIKYNNKAHIWPLSLKKKRIFSYNAHVLNVAPGCTFLQSDWLHSNSPDFSNINLHD